MEVRRDFFREQDGRHFFDPGQLSHASGHFTPERLAFLRRDIHMGRLRSLGFKGRRGDIGGEDLAAAAASGLVTNPAFLDIVDDQLVRAACFCCYYTRSRRRAAEVTSQVQTILRYYSQESYLSSNAFLRNICSLSRDLHPAEERQVRSHVHRGQQDVLDAGGASHRMRNKVFRLARRANLPALHSGHLFGPCAGSCLPVSLWLYSSRNTRRFIRCLSRTAKAYDLTITVAIATSSVFALRFKHRVYALSCFAVPGSSHGTPPREEPLKRFWKLVERSLERFAARKITAATAGDKNVSGRPAAAPKRRNARRPRCQRRRGPRAALSGGERPQRRKPGRPDVARRDSPAS